MECKWIGQYTYGEGYPDNVKGKSVPFELELIVNGIEFQGNFSDDETRDIFSDNGIVKGYLENDCISFFKLYPKAWQITEEGRVKILENEDPHFIEYEGVLNQDQFEGSWQIPMHFVGDDGPFTEIYGSGTWSMEKALLH